MECLAEDSASVIFKTYTPQETEIIGKVVGMHLKPGDVVSLFGELGAGKTCFTRGIACGLGIGNEVPIVSPSFTLINEYPGKIPLYHFDLYRLDHIERIFDLGYQEYFYGNGVTVIEWGEKIVDFLPEEYLRVHFSIPTDKMRGIKVEGQGKRFIAIIKKLDKLIAHYLK